MMRLDAKADGIVQRRFMLILKEHGWSIKPWYERKSMKENTLDGRKEGRLLKEREMLTMTEKVSDVSELKEC